MSEKFRLDRKFGFQNTFYTKYINVIINSIGPSIILRSISTKFEENRPKSRAITLCSFDEIYPSTILNHSSPISTLIQSKPTESPVYLNSINDHQRVCSWMYNS